MVVTLDTKRRLTVPAALAPAKPGDDFDAPRCGGKRHLFRRLGGRESWLAVMKACPVSLTMCRPAGVRQPGGGSANERSVDDPDFSNQSIPR
jgi:hypothetical protein